MLEYSELRTFRAVAKHLNFSKAAQEIGLSAPQVTKVIAHLEEKIKCKLLHRTTRNVRLTTEGHTFLNAATRALSSMNEAKQLFEAKTKPEEMSGTIRVTASNTFGTRFLAKPLRQFTKKYPQVQVQVLLTDHYLDFIDDEIDVAIRVMRPLDSSLIAKKVAKNPVSFFASPNYLKKNASPKTIRDLYRHSVLCIPQHLKLTFIRAEILLEEVIQRPSIQCTNGDLLVDIACQGHGILIRSDWGVEKEVKSGQLVKIQLEDELISETGVYVVYLKHKHSPSRVKAFTETLLTTLQTDSV